MRVKSFQVKPNTCITINTSKLLVKDFTRFSTVVFLGKEKLSITDDLQEILPGVKASYRPVNGRFYLGTITLVVDDGVSLEVGNGN